MPKYSYSLDEEHYEGEYDTPAAAAIAGFEDAEEAEDEIGSVLVGKNVPPTQPENLIDADLLIEHVKEAEEYETEWAESWPRMTGEQREELTASIRAAFARWLDCHQLRPTFFNVTHVKKWTRAMLTEEGIQ